MKREDLLKEMKSSIGTKDPVEFFAKMVDVFDLMFNHIENLEKNISKLKKHSSLAIHWESKVAAQMLSDQVNVLRADKETYANEITALKKAFIENKVTQSYAEFCMFWEDTLGWHPFLD